MTNHFIMVNELVKTYGAGDQQVTAVDHVSFHVERGEFIGIMGASGSGKTTLLNMLSTIDTISEGQVFYSRAAAVSKSRDGEEDSVCRQDLFWDISRMNEEELTDFRRENLGFVFQDYNLLDTLTIRENIMLPMALNSEKGGSKKKIEDRVNEVADALHILGILERFPYEVSGGQKQRAACARALVNDPRLIFADEPTGALDSRSSVMLLDTLRVMNEEMGATILMVTHDVFSACYCGRILFLKDGKICAELKKAGMSKREYLNLILDRQSELGEGYGC